MKRYVLYLLAIYLFSAFMITGCAQWGGDNPLGITGGSKDGYGQNDDLSLPGNGSEITIDPELLGPWTSTQGDVSLITLIFNADGTFSLYYAYPDYDYFTGTFYTSGNTITLTIEGDSYTSDYSIKGDRLTITLEGERLVFQRGQIIIN